MTFVLVLKAFLFAATACVSLAAYDRNPSELGTSLSDELLASRRGGGVCRGSLVTPKGFRALLLYVGDGEYDHESPNPSVPNCSGFFCEATFFWRNIAGVSDTVRAKETEKAKRSFAKNWGIPVDDYVKDGKIMFADAYVDPRLNYRCRAMEGEKIHRLGWEVHDQFFGVQVVKELTLGGKFGKGRTALPGTSLLVGQYRIERSRMKKGKVVGLKKFVMIRYESTDPVIPPVDGRMMASCRISQSPWGTGVAYLNVNMPIAGQRFKASWRNVLTMDGGSGFGKFAGVFNV